MLVYRPEGKPMSPGFESVSVQPETEITCQCDKKASSQLPWQRFNRSFNKVAFCSNLSICKAVIHEWAVKGGVKEWCGNKGVAVCFQQFLVVGADRFRADELYLGDSFSIAPADFRIYFGGYMQNDRVVTGICMMSVFEPVWRSFMYLDIAYPKHTVQLELGIKKSGPASVFASPVSITSTCWPVVVFSSLRGNILCFHT